jgi:predicted enzyme related to lactoylglutathione lyase
MPYQDAERVSAFYEKVFGWAMQPLGAEMGNYILAETTETKDSRPTTPGQINGGLFPLKPDWPAQTPLVVISVDDINAATERLTDAGGKVFGEPMQIPGVGHYAAFEDSEGNAAAMLQPQG